ncbi:MAG: D-sedoheptulose 7-phosphate isomerase [Patescibacteria group bacterium]
MALRTALLHDANFLKSVHESVSLVKDCFKNKNKILVAGNGGSAADAQHFAAEFVCKYKRERKGHPAIALTTDTSALTAWSNDYDFNSLFAREVEALGVSGDVFFGISTSGNSKNIIEAVKKAKEMSIKTVCLLGNDGGALRGVADISIVVPSRNTPRIQEVHTMVLHVICEEVEKEF